MRTEYGPRLDITPLVITTSAVDASVTIPQDNPGSPLTGATHAGMTGSLYWVNVDGNPAGIRFGAAAVFGTSATFEVGNSVFGANPVYIPPGTVVHAINAATKTGTVSIVRAMRAS